MTLPIVDSPKSERDSHEAHYRPCCGVWQLAFFLQNLLLIRQNKQLRQTAQKRLEAIAGNPVVVGSQLDDLAGVDLRGALASVPLPVKATARLLIITMSPTCPICESNRATWVEMTRDLRRRTNWQVVWLSRDSVPDTRKYCERTGVPTEDVLADPMHRTWALLSQAVDESKDGTQR